MRVSQLLLPNNNLNFHTQCLSFRLLCFKKQNGNFVYTQLINSWYISWWLHCTYQRNISISIHKPERPACTLWMFNVCIRKVLKKVWKCGWNIHYNERKWKLLYNFFVCLRSFVCLMEVFPFIQSFSIPLHLLMLVNFLSLFTLYILIHQFQVWFMRISHAFSHS